MKSKLKTGNILAILLGSAVLAFGMYNIHSISELTEGGILGLTLFIAHIADISPAITGFILTALCYILGWRILGNRFLFYSIVASIGFSVFYAVFEFFPPLFPEISGYPLAASVFGAGFVGIGVGSSVRAGGAPTGDDALAMGLSKKFSLDIKWIYLISDLSVLCLSLVYIPLHKIVYSLITVILSGQIISYIQKLSFRSKETTLPEKNETEKCVLIGTMRNPEQMQAALSGKFYHIPEARLSDDQFPIRYVALYQSLHKFGADAGIRYYGEVAKCSLVKRREIREIPKSSDVPYYRFDIRNWQKLPNVILPSGSDIVSMSVSLDALLSSRSICELSLKTELQRTIHSRLKEICPLGKSESFILNDATVICENGKITIFKESSVCFSCSFDDFLANSVSITKIIANSIKGM